MLLTRKELRTILGNHRVRVPAEVEKELLDEYGNPITDGQGHVWEYTEQDIHEQLRKRLHRYKDGQQQAPDKPVMMTE